MPDSLLCTVFWQHYRQFRQLSSHENREYRQIIKQLKKEKTIKRVFEKDGELIIVVPQDDKVTRHVIKIIESSKSKLISLDVSDATLSEIFETLAKKVTEHDTHNDQTR